MTQSRGSLLVWNASHSKNTSNNFKVSVDPTSKLQIVRLVYYKLMKYVISKNLQIIKLWTMQVPYGRWNVLKICIPWFYDVKMHFFYAQMA